jgi:hypothetical protein
MGETRKYRHAEDKKSTSGLEIKDKETLQMAIEYFDSKKGSLNLSTIRSSLEFFGKNGEFRYVTPT